MTLRQKHIWRMKMLSSFSIILFMLASCGADSNHCALDGRFLKMNQGEFRVYSPDGSVTDIDTIRVQGGRFEYEMECHDDGLIVIVLPNNYELPVFVSPGKDISLRADATQIKNIEITGTDANEQMTEWRKANADLPANKQTAEAEKFIKENPTSIVSRWLLYKYVISVAKPDIKKSSALTKSIKAAIDKEKREGNDNVISTGQYAWLNRLAVGLQTASAAQQGDALPSFTATDIYGKSVKASDYRLGTAVITLIANYNYDGQNINRQLRNFIEDGNKDIKVLTITLDPSVEDAKKCQRRDSMPWHVVCDQKMWESPIVKALGFSYVPDNILLKNGKVVARHLKYDDLEKKLK